MQVLTQSQIAQIKITASAMVEALEIIDYSVCHALDRFLVAATSDRAIAAYKTTAKIAYHSIMLVAAACFYSGVLARRGWNAFQQWADAFVASCEAYHSVEVNEYVQVPDHEVEAAIALTDELIQACEVAEVADLLEIPASPQSVEADDCSLVALAKLHGLPQAKKWSYTRKLRSAEREAVLALAAS